MGHVLMIESWVGAMSSLLPRAIRESGHRFTFLTRDLHHYLRSAPADPHPLLAADNVLTAETNDPASLARYVGALHEVLEFDGVVTSCDYYLRTAAEIAATLGLPGPPPEAVRRACRKDLARETLDRAGVPGPSFAICDDLATALACAEDVGYPLVLKPLDLCAGMYVRRVDGPEQLRAAYRAAAGFPVNARQQPRVAGVLLESVLDGPEVSVETVTAGGHTHVVGVTDKSVTGEPAFIESGHMFPADLPPEPRDGAVAAAVAALEALGLDDVVCHTEVKLTGLGPRVVEVNPRPAGNQITELIRRVRGVDLPAACAQVALGHEPELDAVETGVGSAAISFLLPERGGFLDSVDGTEGLSGHTGVVDWAIKPVGREIDAATSNNQYLGHVMVTEPGADTARTRAEECVASLRPRFAESSREAAR